MNRIHAVEGTGTAVPISGAWRLWFEHPATSQRNSRAFQLPATPIQITHSRFIRLLSSTATTLPAPFNQFRDFNPIRRQKLSHLTTA